MQSNIFSKFNSYLVPVGSIIAVFVLIPLVILPQVQKIRDNLQVLNQNNERLKRLEVKAVALENLAKAKDELDKNLEIAESALPIQKDVARLVRGVQGLASANGLETSKVEIKPGRTATDSASTAAKTESTQANAQKAAATNEAPATSSKNELLFELTLKGNLASYQSFLKAIESTKRLLILSSFKGTSESGTDYTFNVTISAPFGPLPKISQDQLAEAVAELSANNKKLLKDLESSAFNNVTNNPLPTGPTGIEDPFK